MVRNGQVTYAAGKGIITDVTQAGGYPEYRGVPTKDSDRDGMPDVWESANGLDPNDAADADLDRNADGYPNIEEYLNVLDGTQQAVNGRP